MSQACLPFMSMVFCSGYMPLQPGLLAPMGRYARTPTSAPFELKSLVKALHSRGMECILGTLSIDSDPSLTYAHFFLVNDFEPCD